MQSSSIGLVYERGATAPLGYGTISSILSKYFGVLMPPQPRLWERAIGYVLTSVASVAMALMTAGVSFLWDLSKNIQVLNNQVAVIIEQSSAMAKQTQIQLSEHERRLEMQRLMLQRHTDEIKDLEIKYAATDRRSPH